MEVEQTSIATPILHELLKDVNTVFFNWSHLGMEISKRSWSFSKHTEKLSCIAPSARCLCGECICFPEHQISLVRTWVIYGKYYWPPKCCYCPAELDEGTDPTTRLGCFRFVFLLLYLWN